MALRGKAAVLDRPGGTCAVEELDLRTPVADGLLASVTSSATIA